MDILMQVLPHLGRKEVSKVKFIPRIILPVIQLYRMRAFVVIYGIVLR